MENFTFRNATKIIFGKGAESKVGAETAKYGSKILLHYGGGSIKKYGIYDRVLKYMPEREGRFYSCRRRRKCN